MDALDYWRLCNDLSVVQAALLIVGEDPSGIQERIDHAGAEERPEGYDAAKAALVHAINRKRLAANIVEHEDYPQANWHLTTVSVEDLRAWLGARGIKTGFFFPELQFEAEYLNPLLDYYIGEIYGQRARSCTRCGARGSGWAFAIGVPPGDPRRPSESVKAGGPRVLGRLGGPTTHNERGG
jgi:hypothetical protein